MANDSDLSQSEAKGPESGFAIRGPHLATVPPPRFGRLALCMAAAGALTFGVLGTVAYGVWFNHDQQAYAEAIGGVRQALGMPGAASVVAAGAAMNRVAEPVALSGPAGSTAVPRTAKSQTIASTPALAPTPTTTAPITTTETVVSATSSPAATATPSVSATTPPSASTANPASSTKASLVSDGEEGSKQAVWSGPVARAPAAANPPQTVVADANSATPAPSSSPRPTRRATNAADPAMQPTVGRPGKDARTAQSERRVSSANARHKNSLFARMGLLFRRVDYRQHDSGRQQQDIYSHP